jgi:hypothetical protein
MRVVVSFGKKLNEVLHHAVWALAIDKPIIEGGLVWRRPAFRKLIYRLQIGRV